MSNVLIDRQKIDILANAISDKSGVPVTMTLDEMVEAVDSIEAGSAEPALQAKTYTVDSAGTETITADSGYDGLSSVAVSVPNAAYEVGRLSEFYTQDNSRRWRHRGVLEVESGGWIDAGVEYSSYATYAAISKNTSVTPTESSQTIGGANTMMEGAVTVNAIPSNYVGSGITQRSSSDLTASGATVTVPSGYYSAQASKAVTSGTAGTPTATKGSVSNHSVSITPSVTNTTGYITGSTINGTAVTVSASELASGNKAITQNGTNIDVVGYSTVSVDVQGGGSGGLEYETGTLTLSSDASSPIVMFSDTHTDVPCYINIVDVTGTTATSNSNLYWTFMNWYTPFDAIIKTTNSANMYGRYQYGWKSSSGASAGNIDCTNTGSSSGGLYYLVSTDRFGPYCGSTNRYWRSGRTYKWVAVWAPTT